MTMTPCTYCGADVDDPEPGPCDACGGEDSRCNCECGGNYCGCECHRRAEAWALRMSAASKLRPAAPGASPTQVADSSTSNEAGNSTSNEAGKSETPVEPGLVAESEVGCRIGSRLQSQLLSAAIAAHLGEPTLEALRELLVDLGRQSLSPARQRALAAAGELVGLAPRRWPAWEDRDPMVWASRPCDRCAKRHRFPALGVGVRVVTPNDPRHTDLASTIAVGAIGEVIEWRQYNGPLWVRVEFADGERENFDPCQLEVVAYRDLKPDNVIQPLAVDLPIAPAALVESRPTHWTACIWPPLDRETAMQIQQTDAEAKRGEHDGEGG